MRYYNTSAYQVPLRRCSARNRSPKFVISRLLCEIARIKLEGLRWLGRRGYFAPGSLHTPGDARNEARQRAYDRGTGANVHGVADSFVGRR